MKKYVCGICFNWELGDTDEISVWDSLEDMKKEHWYYPECGIVELEVPDGKGPEEYTDHKWLVEMDLNWGKK